MTVMVLKSLGSLTINKVIKENGYLTIRATDTFTEIEYTIPGIPAHIKLKDRILVWGITSAPVRYSVKHILSIDVLGTGETLLKQPDGTFRVKTEEDNKKCLDAENKAFGRLLGNQWEEIKEKTGLGEMYKQK